MSFDLKLVPDNFHPRPENFERVAYQMARAWESAGRPEHAVDVLAAYAVGMVAAAYSNALTPSEN
jgi:hypothetical protein